MGFDLTGSDVFRYDAIRSDKIRFFYKDINSDWIR